MTAEDSRFYRVGEPSVRITRSAWGYRIRTTTVVEREITGHAAGRIGYMDYGELENLIRASPGFVEKLLDVTFMIGKSGKIFSHEDAVSARMYLDNGFKSIEQTRGWAILLNARYHAEIKDLGIDYPGCLL